MRGIPVDAVSHDDAWAHLMGECQEGASTLLWPRPVGYAARVDALRRILPAFEAMAAAERAESA